MKIIEALKKLRLLEKKIEDNIQSIQRYASGVSTERLPFETEERQRQQVQSLIQANQDLMKEYLSTKGAIERTNQQVTVTIEGYTYTISEWLTIKRTLGRFWAATYAALNTNTGDSRLRNAPHYEGQPSPQVVRFYSEEEKNQQLRVAHDTIHTIDPTLEVVNATTDLIQELWEVIDSVRATDLDEGKK